MKLSEGSSITLGLLAVLLSGLVWSVWVVASLDTKVIAQEKRIESIPDRLSRIEGKLETLILLESNK